MRIFTVDTTTPTISTTTTISRLDPETNTFLATITIEIADAGSGLRSATFLQKPLGRPLSVIPLSVTSGQASLSIAFPDLPDGFYQVQAVDVAGNENQLNFELRTTFENFQVAIDSKQSSGMFVAPDFATLAVADGLIAPPRGMEAFEADAPSFIAWHHVDSYHTFVPQGIAIGTATDHNGNLLPGGFVADNVPIPAPSLNRISSSESIGQGQSRGKGLLYFDLLSHSSSSAPSGHVNSIRGRAP